MSELSSNLAARDQPLTIKVGIYNSDVKRVRIDTGAGRDIILYKYFLALGLGDGHLTPTKIQLEGFTGHKVSTKGSVTLRVILGDGKTTRAEDITFLVIDVNSPYNSILGTPAQSKFYLVASIAHQRIKVPIINGVGHLLIKVYGYQSRWGPSSNWGLAKLKSPMYI